MKHKIIEELFESLLQRHQERLEESMRRSEFVFDSVTSQNKSKHRLIIYRFS